MSKSVLDITDSISPQELEELTTGLIGFNGGGGARLMASIMLEAKIHHLLLPVSVTTPFIMVVPAEDDGGATAIILFFGQHVFCFILPAMGDSMNAYSGLSRGEVNEMGDTQFPYLYTVARERFPQEGAASLRDDFL